MDHCIVILDKSWVAIVLGSN